MNFLKDVYSRFDDYVDLLEKHLGANHCSIIYILCAIITNFTMMAWSKTHSDVVPAVQAQAFRGVFVTVLIYIYSQNKGINLAVSDRSKDRLRILRNVIASLFNIVFSLC